MAFIGNNDGSRTLLSSNEYNIVRFPESGPGFARYTNNSNDFYMLNGVRGQHSDNWANPQTATAFCNTIQKLNKDEPGITIHYGDISAYNPLINLGHKTHNAGNSIDIPEIIHLVIDIRMLEIIISQLTRITFILVDN